MAHARVGVLKTCRAAADWARSSINQLGNGLSCKDHHDTRLDDGARVAEAVAGNLASTYICSKTHGTARAARSGGCAPAHQDCSESDGGATQWRESANRSRLRRRIAEDAQGRRHHARPQKKTVAGPQNKKKHHTTKPRTGAAPPRADPKSSRSPPRSAPAAWPTARRRRRPSCRTSQRRHTARHLRRAARTARRPPAP